METRLVKPEFVVDYATALLGYQQRWWADESPVKIAEKSRRTGFTWTSACKHVFVAATGEANGWYIGYSEEQGNEFIRDVAAWALALHGVALEVNEHVLEDVDPEGGESKNIKAFSIDFDSGKRVTALSSRPRNLRGKQGLVTIDEASFHEDVRGLLKAGLALLIWGGRLEIISTHNGIDNEFNKLLEDVRAGKFKYAIHRVTLDDAIDDGLYKRICLVKGQPWSADSQAEWRQSMLDLYGEGADEELFCIPAKDGVSYFSRDIIESRMRVGRPVLRLKLDQAFAMRPEAERVAHVDAWLRNEVAPQLAKLPRTQKHYLGQDFGRVADLTTMAPATLQPDLVRDVPFMVELQNVPFEQQKQVAFFVLNGLPNFTRAHFDATGNGAYLAEVAAQKFGSHRIAQIKITESWHNETWPALKDALGEGKVLLPSDELVRSDFTAVKRVNGIPKLPNANVVKTVEDGNTKTLRRHGDAAVAVAMMLDATREKMTVPTAGLQVRGL